MKKKTRMNTNQQIYKITYQYTNYRNRILYNLASKKIKNTHFYAQLIYIIT